MKRLLFTLVFLLFARTAFAADVTAASCNTTDVTAAIEASRVGLDSVQFSRVFVPVGKCIWNTFVAAFNVVLQGAGATDNGTVITVDGVSNVIRHPKRVTGFKFILLNGEEVINSAIEDMRIDHNVFENRTGAWAKVMIFIGNSQGSHPDGVIDHNTFVGGRILIVPTFDGGDKFWTTPSSVGKELKGRVFLEDNTFIGTPNNGNVVDENAGGCYVFRHNTVFDMLGEVHSKQGPGRGSRCWEYYENDFTNTSTEARFSPFFLRGGTGVAFNNRLQGKWTFAGAMDNLLSFLEGYGPLCTVYPCKDQIGRGQDQADGSQLLEPAHFWNNTVNGVVTAPTVINPPSTEHIKEGRDYINAPRPGYTPAPYPHPLVAGSTVPIPPLPQPTPNKPPTVSISAPTTTVITTKTITLRATASDDVGVTWMELWWGPLKIAEGPNAESIQKSGLNMMPYKGKTVIAKAVARDADGSETTTTKAFTIPK